MLNYDLPQVAKPSKALQTKNLDLSVISSLVDATVYRIDDALLSAANWVLELVEAAQDLQIATDKQITSEDIANFQKKSRI